MFSEEFAKYKESTLYKLSYNDKVVALRAKLYNLETRKFELYDFLLNIISDAELRKGVNQVQRECDTIPLIKHDGRLMTQDEVNGIEVLEFETPESANAIVAKILKVKLKEGVKNV